jgi:hypothetical protein
VVTCWHGIETGIDLDKLAETGAFISQALGRQPSSARHGLREGRAEAGL